MSLTRAKNRIEGNLGLRFSVTTIRRISDNDHSCCNNRKINLDIRLLRRADVLNVAFNTITI